MMGTQYLWQMRAIVDTCSVDRGYATATGSPSGLVVDHSEYPWACRSSGSVEMMSSSPPISWRISFKACDRGSTQPGVD